MDFITAITEHPRRPGRYVVDVDGRAFATVSLDVLTESKAALGAPLTDALRLRLEEGATALAAYDHALDLLAVRARSARELRQRLARKEFAPAAVEAAIERLARAGLVDDADYARQLARSKLVGRGMSKRRLQQEMFKRGVDRAVADEAIDEVIEEEGVDQSEAIEAVARKRLRSLGGLDAPTRRRRLYAFLARRGYDGDEIRRAMGAVLAGDGEGGGEDVETD